MKTKQRRSQRDLGVRGHVRSTGGTRTVEPDDSLPQRMVPLSHVRTAGAVNVSQRRAERRLRKHRTHTQRTAPTVRRRSSMRVLSWRLVSGMIVVGLAVVLYLFLTANAFFVNSVAIGGEKYLSREEIFRYSNVAKRHIFWVDAEDVESRLEAVPNIADATVYVGWPPDMVQILVTEREPALIWEQGVRVWVDVNGIVMRQREDRPEMLRIVAQGITEPINADARIPQTIVDGALQLRSRYPNIDVLLYQPDKGLGYHDGRGWTVWFGTGEDMDVKLLVYNRVVENILGQGIQPGEIVMSDPDRPYYTILWREGS